MSSISSIMGDEEFFTSDEDEIVPCVGSKIICIGPEVCAWHHAILRAVRENVVMDEEDIDNLQRELAEKRFRVYTAVVTHSLYNLNVAGIMLKNLKDGPLEFESRPAWTLLWSMVQERIEKVDDKLPSEEHLVQMAKALSCLSRDEKVVMSVLIQVLALPGHISLTPLFTAFQFMLSGEVAIPLVQRFVIPSNATPFRFKRNVFTFMTWERAHSFPEGSPIDLHDGSYDVGGCSSRKALDVWDDLRPSFNKAIHSLSSYRKTIPPRFTFADVLDAKINHSCHYETQDLDASYIEFAARHIWSRSDPQDAFRSLFYSYENLMECLEDVSILGGAAVHAWMTYCGSPPDWDFGDVDATNAGDSMKCIERVVRLARKAGLKHFMVSSRRDRSGMKLVVLPRFSGKRIFEVFCGHRAIDSFPHAACKAPAIYKPRYDHVDIKNEFIIAYALRIMDVETPDVKHMSFKNRLKYAKRGFALTLPTRVIERGWETSTSFYTRISDKIKHLMDMGESPRVIADLLVAQSHLKHASSKTADIAYPVFLKGDVLPRSDDYLVLIHNPDGATLSVAACDYDGELIEKDDKTSEDDISPVIIKRSSLERMRGPEAIIEEHIFEFMCEYVSSDPDTEDPAFDKEAKLGETRAAYEEVKFLSTSFHS